MTTAIGPLAGDALIDFEDQAINLVLTSLDYYAVVTAMTDTGWAPTQTIYLSVSCRRGNVKYQSPDLPMNLNAVQEWIDTWKRAPVRRR